MWTQRGGEVERLAQGPGARQAISEIEWGGILRAEVLAVWPERETCTVGPGVEGGSKRGGWRWQRPPNLQIWMVGPSFLIPKLHQIQYFAPQLPSSLGKASFLTVLGFVIADLWRVREELLMAVST